jgi:hypothetical protein
MNKRIDKLLVKAGAYFSGEGVVYDTFDPKKFAELIVRECLGMIENEAAQYAEPVWAFELVNDIKEHFGVEE